MSDLTLCRICGKKADVLTHSAKDDVGKKSTDSVVVKPYCYTHLPPVFRYASN